MEVSSLSDGRTTLSNNQVETVVVLFAVIEWERKKATKRAAKEDGRNARDRARPLAYARDCIDMIHALLILIMAAN